MVWQLKESQYTTLLSVEHPVLFAYVPVIQEYAFVLAEAVDAQEMMDNLVKSKQRKAPDVLQ
mgnify:CR=1 FL=1